MGKRWLKKSGHITSSFNSELNFFLGLSERFELYANSFEIVNAYTEQNDPAKQRAMFTQQRGIDSCFDDVDNIENRAFIRALEYGLPPTAGWGVGIDRLVMVMTGQRSIRRVVLFPTMRPATTSMPS